MAQQLINIGHTANDRSGDPLRVAFDKINQNFTELYATDVSTAYHLGDDVQFVDVDATSGIVVVQSGFDKSMPVYIKGGNCSDGGVGGDVYIEAGGAGLPNLGTTGVVGIAGREISLDVEGGSLFMTTGEAGNTFINFPANGNEQIALQGAEIASLPGSNGMAVASFDGPVILSSMAGNSTMQSWRFDGSGTINTPLLLPLTFTATLDTAHCTSDPELSLTGEAWYYGVTFACDPNGNVETQIDGNRVWPFNQNANYPIGSTFDFTDADHGIPGYTLTITVTDVLTLQIGLALDLACTLAPTYPATFNSSGAIKLTSNDNNWTFGTTGETTLPGVLNVFNGLGGSITGPNGVNIFARNATPLGLVWSLDDQENSQSGNPLFNAITNSLQFGIAGVSIEVNPVEGGGVWYFAPNKTLRLPPGGDIVDSNGDSVLGGGGNANTGDLAFVGSAMYNLTGVIVENADLSHAATAALTLPTNGYNTPVQLANTYGSVQITAGDYPTIKDWFFNGDGTTTFPNNTIASPVNTPESGGIFIGIQNYTTLSAGGPPYWSYEFSGTDTVLTQWLDGVCSLIWPVGHPEQAVTFIGCGFNSGTNVWTITFSGPLASGPFTATWSNYVAPIYENLNLASGDKNWAFRNDGTFNLPTTSDSSAVIQSTSHIKIKASNKVWSFASDGNLTLPPGGDIKNSSGSSVLGGSSTGGISFSTTSIGTIDPGSNINIVTRGISGAPTNTWTFSSNGDLAVPGNISVTNTINSSSGTLYLNYNSNNVIQLGGGTGRTIVQTPRFQVLSTPPTSSKGSDGDLVGMVAFDQNYIYYCSGSYNGSSDIWHRVVWTDNTW